MEIYSEKLMDCFLEPRGFGDLEDYQCSFEITSQEDGINVVFFAKVEDNLVNISYKVGGCSVIIAVCCAIFDLYNKKPLNVAKSANIDEISSYLDGVPSEKQRCATYALRAFLETINRCA